jgi:hypothetical protein
VLILLITALALGFVHGLGADHLMAIAALSLQPGHEPAAVKRARALAVAVQFALGHALVLALGAGALLLIGWSLPLVFERGGELLGGVLLVLLGVIALGSIIGRRVYGHSHQHAREPGPHWHLHIGSRDHHPRPGAHTHVPTIVGAAFAVSSLRALTMLAPFGDHVGRASLPLMLVLIVVFAVGLLCSMSLFGVALARVMTAHAVTRLGHAAAGTMAICSILLGVYWIFRV